MRKTDRLVVNEDDIHFRMRDTDRFDRVLDGWSAGKAVYECMLASI